MRTLANANLCGFGNARLGVADMHVCECMCRCMHTCFAFVYESGEVLGVKWDFMRWTVCVWLLGQQDGA
jgi:hypothetical protein